MKRVINSNIVNLLDIKIEFEPYQSSNPYKVAASSILPVTDELGNILDDQAYEDWIDFILNLEGAIINLDFEIYKDGKGDNDVSHYYYLRYKRPDGSIIEKTMYKVRVSNHKRSKARIKKDKEERNYFKESKNIKLKFKSIIVNGERYNSYNEAYNKSEEILKEVRNDLLKSSEPR